MAIGTLICLSWVTLVDRFSSAALVLVASHAPAFIAVCSMDVSSSISSRYSMNLCFSRRVIAVLISPISLTGSLFHLSPSALSNIAYALSSHILESLSLSTLKRCIMFPCCFLCFFQIPFFISTLALRRGILRVVDGACRPRGAIIL